MGEVLRPYPGGGTYGRCRKCQREGLKVIEVPKLEPVYPVGWQKPRS